MTAEELKAIEKLTNAVKELNYTLTAIADMKMLELSKDLDISSNTTRIKLNKNIVSFNALIDSIRASNEETDL
jgi:hypothetical protein